MAFISDISEGTNDRAAVFRRWPLSQQQAEDWGSTAAELALGESPSNPLVWDQHRSRPSSFVRTVHQAPEAAVLAPRRL